MAERYVAFDVETPNSANDRMSAIGIAVVEDGRIVLQGDFLVNPETHFDGFNVRLTGITPQMTADRPTFGQLWRTIGPVLDSGLLVAHNAPFDLSVLAKCLRDYGIAWKPWVQYACTCQMGRRLMPGLPDYRLNTLCNVLHLELDHHRAGSDSRACGEILLHYLRSGANLRPFVRTYDLERICTVKR